MKTIKLTTIEFQFLILLLNKVEAAEKNEKKKEGISNLIGEILLQNN